MARQGLSALAPTLPNQTDTFALRAIASHDAQVARAAWAEWNAAVGDPLKAWMGPRSVTRRHAVALHGAIARSDLPVGAQLLTQVRLAVTRERLRAEVVASAVDEVLTAASVAVRAPVLVGDVAAAATYPEPDQRHVHDLDLLVGPDQVHPVLEAMDDRLRPGGQADRRAELHHLRHRSGLAVVLRSRVLDDPAFRWTAPRAQRLPGRASASVLVPEEAFVRICTLAVVGDAGWSGTWALDLGHLLDGCHGLDADAVGARAIGTSTAPAIQAALTWWTAALGDRPLITAVLDRLEGAALPPGRAANDALLAAARRSTPGGARQMVRRAGSASAAVSVSAALVAAGVRRRWVRVG